MIKVDPGQLVDRAEVAAIAGLRNPNAVSVYAKRYSDFPAPAVQKGRCVLWLRSDVEHWVRARSKRMDDPRRSEAGRDARAQPTQDR